MSSSIIESANKIDNNNVCVPEIDEERAELERTNARHQIRTLLLNRVLPWLAAKSHLNR